MQVENIERVVCCVCGRQFSRPAFHVAKSALPVCAGCMRARGVSGGYEPMIQIEVGEYQRLLKLYYAAFERAHVLGGSVEPEKQKGEADIILNTALEQCNRYFEGGSHAGC